MVREDIAMARVVWSPDTGWTEEGCEVDLLPTPSGGIVAMVRDLSDACNEIRRAAADDRLFVCARVAGHINSAGDTGHYGRSRGEPVLLVSPSCYVEQAWQRQGALSEMIAAERADAAYIRWIG
jgi:hypothetical protein